MEGQDSIEQELELRRILVREQASAIDDIELRFAVWEDEHPEDFIWLQNRLDLMRQRVMDAVRTETADTTP